LPHTEEVIHGSEAALDDHEEGDDPGRDGEGADRQGGDQDAAETSDPVVRQGHGRHGVGRFEGRGS
jgi:hypothetical protein